MNGKNSLASRRQLLISAGALSVGLLPLAIRNALAAGVDPKEVAKALAGVKVSAPPPKPAQFTFSGDTVVGPWGAVRVGRNGSQVLPVMIQSADKLGLVALGQKQPAVTIGVDRADAITLTSEGVAFGKGAKAEAWSAAMVDKLTKSIASDRQKARALMQLRAAFVSGFPAYLASTKSTTDKRVTAAHNKASRGMSDTGCTTSTVTDTVQHTVTEAVEQWKSAEQQFDECFEHETSGASNLACSLAPAGAARDACAATVCGAKGFVDLLVAVVEVTRTVTEEVTRNVVTCVSVVAGKYKNVWNIVDRTLPGLEKPGATAAKISDKDVQEALDLFKSVGNPLGSFAVCLFQGKWSIESAQTPIPMGDGNLAIPYGVRVCISADCARNLTIQGVGSDLLTAWPAALTLLAAMSPEFLTFLTTAGIPMTIPPAVLAAVGILPPAAASAAVIMLAFLILALIYGTALAGELSAAEALGAFADGEVCIVHPTIALAMIKVLTLGFVPAELVPPIVVG